MFTIVVEWFFSLPYCFSVCAYLVLFGLISFVSFLDDDKKGENGCVLCVLFFWRMDVCLYFEIF